MFASDETVDIGKDSGTPVTPNYPPKNNHFTGTVNWVQLDIGADAADPDHFISPEDRYCVVLGRQ
jgi:hypothetical protein